MSRRSARFLGFTVSPHEECAVEEAVRIVEAHGGSSTVLTLGPEEAIDQLREAMAIGIDGAILLETDGSEWSATDTAAAIGETIRTHEAADGPFDLIMLGNEAADTGARRTRCRHPALPEVPLDFTNARPFAVSFRLVRSVRF